MCHSFVVAIVGYLSGGGGFTLNLEDQAAKVCFYFFLIQAVMDGIQVRHVIPEHIPRHGNRRMSKYLLPNELRLGNSSLLRPLP